MNQTPSSPPTPSPSSAEEVSGWLASDNPALKQQAYAALVHPQFPVRPFENELHDLASGGNTQARHIAAVAMGKDPAFVDLLASMLEKEEHSIVRIAVAHALFRISKCPDTALMGLATMLLSSNESERKIAEAALNNGATNRFSIVAKVIANAPHEQLNAEALCAFAAAAQSSPDSQHAATEWLEQLATKPLSLTQRLGICAALARLTDGKAGLTELWSVAESNQPQSLRIEAMAVLGSLGTLAAPCRKLATRLLTSEQDEECVVALCRLIVELKTPPDTLPVEFLLQVIAHSQSSPIVAGACMLLSMGGRDFEKYAAIVATRHARSSEPILAPLAACYEILAGMCIAQPTA